MAQRADIAIIGAGVIGLAVASQVAREDREVYILEKNESFGREASSRNSGTIHTSVLYPRGSLNARLCQESNRLLYELCRQYAVDHSRCGKILVAGGKEEISALEAIYQRREDGVRMEWLSGAEIRRMEPEVKGDAAVLLPEAGVVDAHALLRCYLGLARTRGAQLVCHSEVVGLEKTSAGYRVRIRDSAGLSTLETRAVINCAGLQSDKIAAMAGIDIDKEGYRLNYFKGEYYSICAGKAQRINRRLVYPMLRPQGLIGIHTVLDIDGRVRLGPDFYPVHELDYSLDDSRKTLFYEGVKALFPFVEYEDIQPESTGIMPRLYSGNEKFKEFIIRHEVDRGLPGLISVAGIESPGLTASLAIALKVSGFVEEIFRN
jgi:L-2-hydroxyglutarate oxidase LhgO